LSVVRQNIIANVLGKTLSTVLSVIFVPIYLKYLGAEAYGLVGIFAALQSIIMIADMGLSGTFTRETARLSAITNSEQQLQDLCRTFEKLFLAIGLLIIVIIAALSGIISEHWVNLENLSIATVSKSIVLIGLALGLQFPFFIYQGGLLGLQHHILLNILILSLGFLRGIGAILILKFVSPSIQSFFIWQVIISLLQFISGHLIIWRILPKTQGKPRFDLNLFRPLWRFALGTGGITLTGIILTQSDKIILTKILSLEKFGYYTIAGMVASVPGMIAIPFSSAIYPRFTQLVTTNKLSTLTELYHRSCQTLAVILLPAGLMIAVYSKELILVWTGNQVTTQNTYIIASILTIGSVLMGLMVIPFVLQLSFGWTRLGFYLNLIGVFIIIPTMIWLVSIYESLGACYVWVMLYTGQFVVMIHLMHQRILTEEKHKWYVEDVLKPLLAPLIIYSAARIFIDETFSTPLLIMVLIVLYAASTFISCLVTNHVRKMLFQHILRSNIMRKIGC
jgi:O-antigen/teichoic acid export membrane protein